MVLIKKLLLNAKYEHGKFFTIMNFHILSRIIKLGLWDLNIRFSPYPRDINLSPCPQYSNPVVATALMIKDLIYKTIVHAQLCNYSCCINADWSIVARVRHGWSIIALPAIAITTAMLEPGLWDDSLIVRDRHLGRCGHWSVYSKIFLNQSFLPIPIITLLYALILFYKGN